MMKGCSGKGPCRMGGEMTDFMRNWSVQKDAGQAEGKILRKVLSQNWGYVLQ